MSESKNYLITIVLLTFLIFFFSCEDKNYNLDDGNAIWVESYFLRGFNSNKELLDKGQIISFANKMKEYNYKYIYLFAGPFNKDGSLPEYSQSNMAKQSINIIQQTYPEIIILPWVGGIQYKSVFLENEEWRDNAIKSIKKLVINLDVPGIHVDFELINKNEEFFDIEIRSYHEADYNNYSSNLTKFHEDLRLEIPDAYISSVVPAPSSVTRPWKRKLKLNELKDLLFFVDEISYLFYDTSIDNQFAFQQASDSLLNNALVLKSNFPNVKQLVAIGTFRNVEELQKYRVMKIESLYNTFNTLKRSIDFYENNPFSGIAVYCNWQTSNIEFRELIKYHEQIFH